ncbi:MAG: hypothetical protein ABSC11_02150 [Smithella sp.]|jgi:hypothetical protein
MGALPRLKKKDELRYRKGSTNETRNCQYCTNLRTLEIANVDNGKRCLIMGLKTSARYRVRPDYTCDAQEYNGR